MKKIICYSLLVSVSIFGFGCSTNKPVMKEEMKNMSHVHMGHVGTKWIDTPGQVGLLTTLKEEAEIAKFHVDLAMKQPENLDWLKTHTKHVRHAVDAASESAGPGKGYGVLKAVKGVEQHINFSANSADASQNIKLHAIHVTTSAKNIVNWSGEIMSLSQTVLSSSSAQEAEGAVQAIQNMIGQILAGVDADGDGAITWKAGEGGLKQMEKHFMFMRIGEGME